MFLCVFCVCIFVCSCVFLCVFLCVFVIMCFFLCVYFVRFCVSFVFCCVYFVWLFNLGSQKGTENVRWAKGFMVFMLAICGDVEAWVHSFPET